MALAYILKTSFSYLFGKNFKHSWVDFWVDLDIEDPNVFPKECIHIFFVSPCLRTSNGLSMGELISTTTIHHFNIIRQGFLANYVF